jgi:hypothetical protein
MPSTASGCCASPHCPPRRLLSSWSGRRPVDRAAAIGVSILVLANFLLAPVGVTGIGIAYLTVQWAAALIALGPLVKLIRSTGRRTDAAADSVEVQRPVDV